MTNKTYKQFKKELLKDKRIKKSYENLEPEYAVIKIPATQKRFNPYMEEYYGSYPTLTGLVDKNDCGNIEMGFAYTIDMDYANKGDQFTDIFYKVYDMQEDEFVELCKKLEIQFFDLVAYTKLLKEACASPSETQSA